MSNEKLNKIVIDYVRKEYDYIDPSDEVAIANSFQAWQTAEERMRELEERNAHLEKRVVQTVKQRETLRRKVSRMQAGAAEAMEGKRVLHCH